MQIRARQPAKWTLTQWNINSWVNWGHAIIEKMDENIFILLHTVKMELLF